MVSFSIFKIFGACGLSLGFLVYTSLIAQQSDFDRDAEALEAIPEEANVAEALPSAIVEEDGTCQFYLIEPVRRKRPRLFVQAEAGFEEIQPSYAALGPLHRLSSNGRVLFYERVQVQVEGQTSWQHVPRYTLSLEGYNGGKAVVFLSGRTASIRSAQAEVQTLRWIELSTDFCDFGEIALVNPLERPIAVQMDGENALLKPGQSKKIRFSLWKKQTAAVHVRIAMPFADGAPQNLYDRRVFIFENWRGILIPYYDTDAGELSLISIKEETREIYQ